MLPLSDGLAARRFPIVNISIIVANFAVWLFYELPHLRSSVLHASAWFFLGAWFLYQLVEANLGLFGATANGGGVAFFAHVGGFLFGVVVAQLLTSAGRVVPQGGIPVRVPV
jgi:membrane associated rhomboid family serine protease